ncbi:hemicentin-1-like [Babylonia areolata]|uniref:hemicentin-1-like n=1 Tax=Babylonia areolata TaxID=304850 RepID=UPI003FD20D27
MVTSLLTCVLPLVLLADPGSGQCTGNVQADMVFVLDASGSVGSSNFQTMLSFVQDLVSGFDIGSNKVRVGVQKFSSSTNTEFNLNTYYDQTAINTAVANIYYSGGTTNTGGALEYLRTTMFTSGNGDRSSVTNLGVILSDGVSNDASYTATQAAYARNAGITLFSIGIGSGIPLSELNEIATDPDSDHVFSVSSFSALSGITSAFQAQACPAVNGNWGSWGSWGGCTKTCGTGTKTRTRACDNPAPSNGGSDCSGSGTDSSNCNTQGCPGNLTSHRWLPVDCRHWDFNSLPCQKSKTDVAVYGVLGIKRCGNIVTGMVQTMRQLNGGWGNWASWGACSVTCNSGTQTRTRNCDSPAPLNNGAYCSGSDTDSQNCFPVHCPVNGGWTSWTSWGTCSTTCELGSWTRSRSCTNPAPAHNGAQCSGADLDTTSCDLGPCPVDGAWGTWEAWGTCSVTCMAVGVRNRLHHCDSPPAQYGGADCPGSDTETQTCDYRLTLCDPGNGWAVQVYATTAGTPVHGGFNNWGAWSACSKTCGAGVRVRTRQCNNPVPKYGGDVCSGDYFQTEMCNNMACSSVNSYTQQHCTGREYFTCASGSQCIHFLKRCDCAQDCADGSDETVDYAGCSSDLEQCTNGAAGLCPRLLLTALLSVLVTCVLSCLLGGQPGPL